MKNNKVINNAIWILFGKIVQALLGVFVTMFSARYLGPAGYGTINYAANIVAFVAPIMYLGLNGIIVQELINKKDKQGEIIGTAVIMTLISSFICIIGVISFVLIANRGEKDTIIVCSLYSILLIFQAFDIIKYWFQAELKSKYSSVVMLIAYIIMSIYKIFLLINGKNVYWFAVSQSIDYAIIAIGLFLIYKKIGEGKLSFSWKIAKNMFRRSRHYILSDLMIAIFAHTDTIMIKLMIDEEAVGFYTAGVYCAGMTSFIFSALIDSARPVIFESKKINEMAFEKNVSRLYTIVIYLALFQSLAMTIFSPLIIRILYGNSYLESIDVLRVIVWYTTFSYVGSVRNIWILAKEKQKYLWVLNLSGAIANVLLNFLLIPILGIIGAAIASLITQIFTNVFMNMIVFPIRRVNILMLKGLNPKNITEFLKKK